jgi:acetyltransferase
MAEATTAESTSRLPLDAFFAPKSIAVIGASDRAGTVGRTLLWNLLHSPFQERVYAVNPSRSEALGIKSYKSITELPETVDLAVVATPAETVPRVIRECVDAGFKAAVVISAGFREQGPKGAELERQIHEQLRRGTLRLIGPNCLGVMNPIVGLNATFAQKPAQPGNVAFLSQSGALLTAILDWSFREQVGFSAVVSTGSMLDVGWGDLIYYFGDDTHTQSILLYMESIGDARSFLSAAREVALSKPIIVIKTGRSEAASRAAASHTGALTGTDEVFDAAFRRCGVLRVNSIGDLFYMTEVLAKQPRPKGPRLTILTNAGGPGVLATDALVANGGELAALSEGSLRALDQILPAHWSHHNPIDILGDASSDRYAQALEVAMADPNSDGLLVVLAPQGMTDPAGVAERLKPYAKGSGKPVLASWMGGPAVAPGEAILNAAGVPTFAYPDTAARAFTYMWRYSYNLRGLYETPTVAKAPDAAGTARGQSEAIIERARGRDRVLLTEFESKRILSAYGIPTVETRIAGTEAEAVQSAKETGYPVVLKVHSETITHKTDIGGVKLNLQDEGSVRSAYRAIESSVVGKAGREHFLGVTVQPMARLDGYELILGSSVDPQFGPVVLFGSGGELVEVYRDRALALPPLNTTLARRLMEQTRILAALQGARGRPAVDLAALEAMLVRFSQLVAEQRWIKEIDINPLLASPERLIALDARMVLHERALAVDQLPRLAIRPYPTEYVSPWTMNDGTAVTIRPIRPEDEPLMVKFHETLSERSVYLRYFYFYSLSSRVAHERLVRMCFVDYARGMALVANREEASSATSEILGVGRLSKLHGKNEAEVAVLVTDRYQHRGLGSELLRRLVKIAQDENLDRIVAEVLRENTEMQALIKRFGFELHPSDDPGVLVAMLDL